MNKEMLQEKFNNLLADEGFVNALSQTKTASEVAAIFNASGVEMSAVEAQQIMDYVTQKEELDENALDNVSGGIVWSSVYLACFAIGVGAGLAHGAYNNLKKAWS